MSTWGACGDGGDVGGGGGSGGVGGLNPLYKPWHPKVAHGVLELLAVDVTFELLGMLLNPCSPIILYFIVRSARQVLRNFGPSA